MHEAHFYANSTVRINYNVLHFIITLVFFKQALVLRMKVIKQVMVIEPSDSDSDSEPRSKRPKCCECYFVWGDTTVHIYIYFHFSERESI